VLPSHSPCSPCGAGLRSIGSLQLAFHGDVMSVVCVIVLPLPQMTNNEPLGCWAAVGMLQPPPPRRLGLDVAGSQGPRGSFA
jgi:hypothetical protein